MPELNWQSVYLGRPNRPCPGGWKYREVALDWELRAPPGMDLMQASREVYKIRKANPASGLSLDLDQIALEIVVQNAERIAKKDARLIDLFAAKKVVERLNLPQPHLNPPRAEKVVAAVNVGPRHYQKGKQALLDWLGEGGAVPSKTAEDRAAICVQCPKNVPGSWWDKVIGLAGDMFRVWFQLKDDLHLQTSFDDRLGTCDACGCPLKLKVHSQMPRILEYTEDDEWLAIEAKTWNGKPAPECWIKKP